MLGCASCTTLRREQSTIPDSAVRTAKPSVAWEVIEPTGALLGYAVRFDGTGGDRFFSVRNVWHQELGMVDASGRAWRRRPFTEDPEWLGTGTVAEGVLSILAAPEGATLQEVPLEALR